MTDYFPPQYPGEPGDGADQPGYGPGQPDYGRPPGYGPVFLTEESDGWCLNKTEAG